MLHFVDSHCHLHDSTFFKPDIAEACLERARAVGVKEIVCISTDPDDSLSARDFATTHEAVYWTFGIHPEHATFDLAVERARLASELSSYACGSSTKHSKLVAIGEVGLDYHYDGYDRASQIRLFEEMLQLAMDQNLPVSFHVREAFDDFFPVVANFPSIKGVIHSFTDSKKVLKRILNETDFYIGVNGLATYSTLPTPPLERIMLETDAPFLAPVPHRGETNEPSYIPDVAHWLSQKLGVSLGELARVTTANSSGLFLSCL